LAKVGSATAHDVTCIVIYMYGLIAKLTITPGRRDEMVGILKESAAGMPGCFSYIVAHDSADQNVLWVTEVWESAASHDGSLSLPSVQNAIPRGKEIVARFDKVAVTSPVWGVGSSAVQTP
jgi:quinol monooxygenase YgiN